MPNAIALDIGGTKIEGVLFNEKYKELKKERILFNRNAPQKEILRIIFNIISNLKTNKLNGIGISIPDHVSPSGKLSGMCKIKSIRNLSLRSILQKKYKCKVIVQNDADCFAVAEHFLGAAKGADTSIGVIIGTGIGSGIILKDQLYLSKRGSAAEFGHNVINPSGPKCRCGLNGDIESFAAGPNLVRNYKAKGGKLKNPDPKIIFLSKEKAAKDSVKEALEALAIGISSLINIFDPDIIVLGGGLSNLSLTEKLIALTKKYTMIDFRNNFKIVKNKLGDSAGVYGAAYLIFNK